MTDPAPNPTDDPHYGDYQSMIVRAAAPYSVLYRVSCAVCNFESKTVYDLGAAAGAANRHDRTSGHRANVHRERRALGLAQ